MTDDWGIGFDAVGLGIGAGAGGVYSTADSQEELEGIDTCASVAIGAGGSYYAEVCVGDGWSYTISAGGGWNLGLTFSMTGSAVFSVDFTDVKRQLRCERREAKQRQKLAARPYVDVYTPSDGQSAGTPGGASTGRPDILGPSFR